MSAPISTPKPRPVARVALAALLFVMAASQLSDPSGFIDIVTSYRIGGAAIAAIVGIALMAGEVTAAAGLVSRDQTRRYRAASVAVAVALGWGVLGAQAFARGIALDNCGCFGVHAGQPLRWFVLIEDVEFLALARWIRSRTSRAGASDPSARVAGRDRRRPVQPRSSSAATMASTGMRSR